MSFLNNFLVFMLVFNFGCSSKVPLFLWSNIKELSCHRNSPGLTESVSTYFTNEYMKCLSSYHPDSVVLFVYDKLGIEDISLYGQEDMKKNAFKNIQHMKKVHASFVLPEVESSNIVEDLFQKFNGATNDAKIKIVRLPAVDRSNADTTFNGLQTVDNEIMDVISATKGKYIAVVTSENALNNVASRQSRETVGRQLLSTDDDKDDNSTKPVYLVSPCLYMTFLAVDLTISQTFPTKKTFSNALQLQSNHSGLIDISNGTVCPPSLLPNETYPAGNVSVTLNFTGLPLYKTVEMSMVFVRSGIQSVDGRVWWSLMDFRLSISPNETAIPDVDLSHEISLNPRLFKDIVAAPDDLSFACSQTSGLTDRTAGNSNATFYVQFDKLQVQPFGVNESIIDLKRQPSFTQAVDCAGWYTGPIWSGLIVTLLLLSVLSYGLAMISKVTTMDRFDDPRGKTISVPQESN